MQNGKNIKVFLSSTFKDMDAERDLIMNRVAPMLQERLAPEGMSVQFIDLRWGVNTQDADENERENTVLRECINEIRESRPFFIGLLGGRYGWIPSDDSWQVMLDEMTVEERLFIRQESQEQKSVTELEILFGALMDAGSLRRSLFCFRKPEVYKQMDDVARTKFCNQEVEADHKLDVLKQKIVKGCEAAQCSNNIYEYDSQWDGQTLTGLDKLADFLCYTLYQQILLYESSHEVQNPENEFQMLLDADEQKVNREISSYCAEEQVLQEIEGDVYSARPTIIQGIPGSGHTALLCKLYSRVCKMRQSRGLPLIHFCKHGDNLAVVFKKWLADPRLNVSCRYGLEEHVSIEELSLQLLKAQRQLNEVFYLFVDDLHLLKDCYKLINSTLITSGKVVLVATVEEQPLMIYEFWESLDKARFIRLKSVVTEKVARQIVEHELKKVGKSLPEEVMGRILGIGTSFPSYIYPLWLKLVVRKLTMLSADNFEKIRQRGNGDEAITQYLLEMVDDIGANATVIEPMFASILFDAGKFLPFSFFWTMIRLLAVSEYGLREDDFKQIMGEQWDQLSFTVTKRWLGDLLRFDEANGAIDFAYPCYRRLLRHYCQDTDEEYPQIQKMVASHFFSSYSNHPNDTFIVDEVTHLTIMLNDDEVLKAVLSVPDSLIWTSMADKVVGLMGADIQAAQALFRKALSVSENGKVFLTDVAMNLYLHDNDYLASSIMELFDDDLKTKFLRGEIDKYNPNNWEYEKLHQMLCQLHYAGFMLFAGDDFVSSLLTHMTAYDSDLLSDSGFDNEDKQIVISFVNRFVNLWTGGDDELEEVDTSAYSPEELVDYAEKLLFMLFAPKHAEEILRQYEREKGDIPETDAIDIRANTLHCMLEVNQENPQAMMDYYEQLHPHLKNLPDDAAVLAASKFLLLWNIVRKNISDDRSSMYHRSEEAFSTFNSVWKVRQADDNDSVLLLQLCFYNLCSTTEYCVKDMLYRGEHENAQKAIQTMNQAIGMMKQVNQNSLLTILAYSLADAVLSFYYEQHGDALHAFYYHKQHEYAVFMGYQRLPLIEELKRRYAASVDENGWLLLTAYRQVDEADREFAKAMNIFRELFENAPSNLHADDLLQCAYRQMRTLREKGLHAESIEKGQECLELVNAKEDVNPDPQAVSMLHDEIGDAYATIGRLSEASAEMQLAGEGFRKLYEADSDNENLMRSVVINGVRTAMFLGFKAEQPENALGILRGIMPVVEKAVTQQPDSIKVRNIAINYFVCLAQVDLTVGNQEEAIEYMNAIVKRLYSEIVDHQRADDYPLLLDCLKQLYNTALKTNSVQMACDCAQLELEIKQDFVEKRMLAIESADMETTKWRIEQAEQLKKK